MEDRDPVADARDLVCERFPTALWAVLTGSVLTAHRTSGSDLDIVVCVDIDHPGAPYREALLWRDWPVELFVNHEPGLRHYRAAELAQRKPSLHRMLATGVTIAGDPDAAETVRRDCARVLSVGPGPLSGATLDRARYGLTDLLDDLAHSVDEGETVVLVTSVWLAAADLACAIAGHWAGRGKWTLRELRDLDGEFARRWLAAHGDRLAVAAVANEVLDSSGGPLFAGYRAGGELPAA
jgi:hypothetical protein